MQNGMLSSEVERTLIKWENDTKALINSLGILANLLVIDTEESAMEEDTDTPVPKELVSAYTQAGICNKVLPKCMFMPKEVANFYSFKMIKSYLDNI